MCHCKYLCMNSSTGTFHCSTVESLSPTFISSWLFRSYLSCREAKHIYRRSVNTSNDSCCVSPSNFSHASLQLLKIYLKYTGPRPSHLWCSETQAQKLWKLFWDSRWMLHLTTEVTVKGTQHSRAAEMQKYNLCELELLWKKLFHASCINCFS